MAGSEEIGGGRWFPVRLACLDTMDRQNVNEPAHPAHAWAFRRLK